MSLRKMVRYAFDGMHSLLGVTVAGKRFQLPLGAVLRIEEPWMGDVLRRLLPNFRGDFVDVGANIGQTLLQLRAIEITRRYIGFEPNPSCAAFLLKLIRSNNFKSTDVIPVGCGLEYDVLELHSYQDSLFDSSASLVENFRSDLKVVSTNYVVIAPITKCLEIAGVESISIIKIDIEGFEATVIQALEEMMAVNRPCIVCEVLPVYSIGNHLRLKNGLLIEKILKRVGYKILRIIKNDDLGFKCFTEVREFGIHGDMSLVDYVLIPGECVDLVLAVRP